MLSRTTCSRLPTSVFSSSRLITSALSLKQTTVSVSSSSASSSSHHITLHHVVPSSSASSSRLFTSQSTPTSLATSSSSSSSSSSSAASVAGGTGIVMLNMGGPSTVAEVGPFLQRLFSDGEIIQLGPLQNILGPWISKRRTPKIEKQYAEIGGSPIRKWTEIQGEEMCKILDKISPQTAPHKFYVCFRYAPPLTEDTITAMKRDGIKRAVAFSQYPQWSCTTSGSSLNHLWRELKRLNLSNEFSWSIIDRWYNHPGFIKAVKRRIEMGLQEFPQEVRDKVVIIFSAHSLPMKVVNKGDPYVPEVAATVNSVMQSLNFSNKYILAWQSQVGFLPWMGPQTGDVIEGYAKQGHKNLLVVPIAFTSDHVETLYEIDKEYAHVAKEAGIERFVRAPSLNDEPLIMEAFADIVKTHLDAQQVCTEQYPVNCPGCTNPICRSIVNPIKPYQKLRDQVNPDGELCQKNPVKGL